MAKTSDLAKAKELHALHGGILFDLGGTYMVSDVHPAEMRSFATPREAMDYGMDLANANYDETEMNYDHFPLSKET